MDMPEGSHVLLLQHLSQNILKSHADFLPLRDKPVMDWQTIFPQKRQLNFHH